MRNDKLREVFENLGFSHVTAIISSGNVIFESDETDTKALEAMIENAWPEQLGFTSTTIVRSQKDLEALIAAKPFEGLIHGPSSYLLVTFFKKPTKIGFQLPYSPPNKTYKLIGEVNNTLFTVTDNTVVKTIDLMTWLEKQYGKEITSRTWKTVERIHKKMINP